jgi:uncharacterized membrane protein YbhN (UPF0104 family)
MDRPETEDLERIPSLVRRGLVWVFLSLMVVAALFWAASALPGTRDSVSAILADAIWAWVGLGWLSMCAALWALGHRWRALLPSSSEASGGLLGTALCAALLLNYALPGPFGEVAASLLVHRRCGVTAERCMAAGAASRLVGLATAALGAGTVWLLFPMDVPTLWIGPLRLLVAGILLGGCFLLWLMRSPLGWLSRLESISARGIAARITQALRRFLQALSETAKLGPRAYAVAFGWSLVGHFLAYLGIAFSLWGLLGSSEWAGLAFTYLAGTSAGALAFVFPGSQLPWDALFATLLVSTCQLSVLEAAAAAALLRAEQLAMMGLGALALVLLVRQAGGLGKGEQ